MENLFSTIKIKNLALGNRIVMPPLAVKNPETDGFVNDVVINYYSEMSKLGMGLVITENAFVTHDSRIMPNQLLISDDMFIDGHRKLVKSIHDNGIPVALEINHGGINIKEVPEVKGMLSNLEEKEFVFDGGPKEGIGYSSLKEIPIKEINRIVKSFGEAAKRAKIAGYDMVEIHSAHGFLLNQFLSPITNNRNDKYGGSLKNRMRLLLEVVEEVREQVGEDFPISVRFPLSDNPPQREVYPGGLKPEEGTIIARELEHIGVDYIDVSGGYCGSRPRELKNIEGYFVPYAKILRENLKIRVNVTGGIKTPQFANEIIKNGWADTVGIGRALLLNKNWIKEAKEKLLNF